MSKRAEEAALKAYPPDVVKTLYGEFDANSVQRMCFWRGYEQAEKDLGWHSVEESLPPVDKEVIVLRNYWTEESINPLHKISFGHMVDKNIAIDYDGWNVPSVVYWMPMPKLPKEEQK